jgi:hypothetical protein
MPRPKRDPVGREGGRRVPMHPWGDPSNHNRPVTREELIKVMATLDAACLARHHRPTLRERLARLNPWRKA